MKHDQSQIIRSQAEALLATAFKGLSPLARDLAASQQVLDRLKDASDETHLPQIRALTKDLQSFEPSITLIGQVKAGKTSLVNALQGGQGLLPSDINPWTSVVTSLHQSPGRAKSNEHARFGFFTEDEWGSLMRSGGRVGELANRAGADQELEKVRRQLDELRDMSRKRLGDRFEILLGQTHDYSYVDAELVERYVCLGDTFEAEGDAPGNQGRFADITRSADLFLSAPALPVPLCLRDTPGVNDTFMVREQITLKALRGSRSCVVVLSAHQALSNVDLALIRLIAQVPTRDVIIFVNRIDDLSDPATEIPEIEQSIRATLASQSVSNEVEIVFGSAKWANAALSGRLAEIGKSSADALLNWARHNAAQRDMAKDPSAMIWELSGLPALGAAISDRVISGDGADVLARVSAGARNIISSVSASQALTESWIIRGERRKVDPAAIATEIDRIADETQARLETKLEAMVRDLDTRLSKSRETFCARATTALIHHLETYGEQEEWAYDPAGLRLLLKSSYNLFCAKAQIAAEDSYTQGATALRTLFVERFGLSDVGFDLEAPLVPAAPVPVLLGQTIALDIKGPWWSRWWRRKRSYATYADEFRALIEAEIAPVIGDLKGDHAEPHTATLTDLLDKFISAQRAVFLELANRSQDDLDRLREDQSLAAAARAENLQAAETLLAGLGRNRPRAAAKPERIAR